MNKLITLGCIVLVSFNTYAYDSHSQGNNSTADVDAVSGSLAGASIDSHDVVDSVTQAPDLSRSVGYAPSMNGTVGLNVCAKHAGISLGWAGMAVGTLIPLSDKDCNRRMNAITMKNLQSVATGREVMCSDIDVLRASVRAGSFCWLESDELLQELSEAERAYYYKVQEENRVQKLTMQQQLDSRVEARVKDYIQQGIIK